MLAWLFSSTAANSEAPETAAAVTPTPTIPSQVSVGAVYDDLPELQARRELLVTKMNSASKALSR